MGIISWSVDKINDAVESAKKIYDKSVNIAHSTYDKSVIITKSATADALGTGIGKGLQTLDSLETKQKKSEGFEIQYKSMVDNFDDTNIESPLQQCSLLKSTTKAQRRSARLDKINNSREIASKMSNGYEKSTITSAANRLEKYLDDIEFARAANHTYLKYGDQSEFPDYLRTIAQTAPDGMLPVTPEDLEKLNLKPEDLVPKKSSFRASVYKLDPLVWKDKPGDSYVVAFRGSTNSMDWRNDFRQDWGLESDYYRRAVKIGEQLSTSEPGLSGNVHITGQSLGGGLASAASEAGNLNTSTFNAAGINEKIVSKYASHPETFIDQNNITSYYVKGEFLSKLQDSGKAKKAVGTRIELEPHDPKLGSVDKHFTENVIFAFEKVKQSDENLLEKALLKL